MASAATIFAVLSAGALGCSSGGGGDRAARAPAIDLAGGGSPVTAVGGDAGYLYLRTSAPGGVRLKRAGAADTSAVPPRAVDLGATGATVAGSTTAALLGAGNDPGAGVLYVVAGSSSLYVGDGQGTVGDAADVVTGLKVSAGATLVVAPNHDSNADGHPDVARLVFASDVEIAGTFTPGALDAAEAGALATDRAGASLDAAQLLVRPGGRVDVRGGDAAAGSGERGGNGGAASLHAYEQLRNEGTIDAEGGDGPAGGGTGGLVVLAAGEAGTQAGDVVSSGTIAVGGGDATVAGWGGGSGHVTFTAYGSIRTGGALVLDGGAGKGAGAAGGMGGVLQVENHPGNDPSSGSELPVQPIQISGDVSLRGGACEECTGGDGGVWAVSQGPYGGTYAAGAAGIELLGYARAVFDGGDGLAQGGWVWRALDVYTEPDPSGTLPAGGIVNEIDILARGGNATGAGGAGGGGEDIALRWVVDGTVPGGGDIVNSGAIDMSGGASTGANAGGNSAGLQWQTPGDIVNSGRILNRGGAAQGGTGGSGNWWQLSLVAGGDIVNSGAIDTTGGAGASGGPGGAGAPFHVLLDAGGQVRNSASIVSKGGNAASAAGVCGDGGEIELNSAPPGSTSNTATLNVAPGAGGGTAGTVGKIWIDGLDVTPPGGVL